MRVLRGALCLFPIRCLKNVFARKLWKAFGVDREYELSQHASMARIVHGVRTGLAFVLFLIPFEQSPAAEWITIKTDDLSEWSNPGNWWRVENGVFVAESKGGNSLPKVHYLEWKGSTGKDFELSLEYRISADKPQDAGVNFRVERPHPANQPNLPSYQAELDTANLYGKQAPIREGKLFGHIHDGKRSHMFKRGVISTGGVDGRISTKPLPSQFDPAAVFRKPPEWNHCRVVAVGERMQLYLNGVLANEIIDRDPKKSSQGDGIALQYRPSGGYRFEVKHLKFRKWGSTTTSARSESPQSPPSGGSVKQAAELARKGELAAAALMFDAIYAKDPSAMDTMGGLGLATIYAALGEKEKHRQHCERFFRVYSNSQKPVDIERPAKAYLLFPEAGDPVLLRKASADAQRAVEVGRNSMPVWFELTLGMARYRNGDNSGALDSLKRPLKGKSQSQQIPAKAFAAMASYRKDEVARAKTYLSAAESEFQKYRESNPPWNDLLATELAIREARALIE